MTRKEILTIINKTLDSYNTTWQEKKEILADFFCHNTCDDVEVEKFPKYYRVTLFKNHHWNGEFIFNEEGIIYDCISEQSHRYTIKDFIKWWWEK